ncbi:MAG: hypothetical protein ACXV7G_10390 [Halobacteriota archaeon]
MTRGISRDAVLHAKPTRVFWKTGDNTLRLRPAAAPIKTDVTE